MTQTGPLAPSRRSGVQCASLLAAVVLAAADGDATHAADAAVPIFVRCHEQLFQNGGDYERFCAARSNVDRAENRRHVIATQKHHAELSWKVVAEQVSALEQSGDLQAVERYWIVNGFAALASDEAVKTLETLPAVAQVYRVPRSVTPLHRAAAPREPPPAARQIIERVLADWTDDRDEPLALDDVEVPWNVTRIRADFAWRDESATGKGVVVAVNDTGLMVTPSLTRALWKNPRESFNSADDDGNGYVDDLFGYDFDAQSWYALGDHPQTPHGSACAGIIAGRPLNGAHLLTGVAPRCRLMVLRGMGRLKAYEYALENGADVLSLSFMWIAEPLGDYRGLYRLAHEHLAAGGIVAVGGAGNFRQNRPAGQQIALPKDIPCVIAAAGIGEDGKQPAFSSEGPCTWDGVKFYDDYPAAAPLQKPDVSGVAGGYPVWWRPQRVRGNRGRVVSDEGNGSALVIGPQGNSFSGPHAAGVIALMFCVNPKLNAWDAQRLLQSTCQDLGEPGWDRAFGHGLLDAAAAVRAARAAARR